MNVIGLTGFAEVGKSTVAGYLVKEHGFTRLSFAAPLKKMLRQLNPIMGASLVSASGAYNRATRATRARTVRLDEVFNKFQDDELAVKASGYGAEYRRLMAASRTPCRLRSGASLIRDVTQRVSGSSASATAARR